MKHIEATRKYEMSQTIAIFLKKREVIESAVNKNYNK